MRNIEKTYWICQSLFQDIQIITRMKTGSSSINYHIVTKKEDLLVKFIKKSDLVEKERLVANLRSVKFDKKPILLAEKNIENMFVLIFKWKEGKSLRLDNNQLLDDLIKNYLFFLKDIKPNKYIFEAFRPLETLKRPKNKMFQKKLFNVYTELNSFHPKYQIIHGDFHFKNFLFQNRKLSAILDLEELRWGVPTEDLMRMLLTEVEQRKFFRKSACLKILKRILNKTSYSRDEWIYGLNVFIAMKHRKLKTVSFFKLIKLMRCHFLYKVVRRFLENYSY